MVCFMAAIGQGDFQAASAKALKIGALGCYIDDLGDKLVKKLSMSARTEALA
jgi:argininosuccinate synthase